MSYLSDLEEIYRLYADDLYRFLLSLCRDPSLAEELAAETFYRAIKSINSFKGNCKMSVWLMSIGKNLYFDHLKKAENKNLPLDGSDHPDSFDIVIQYENKEQSMNIHRILHTLDEPYKEVFSLRIFSELSFKDIGELFGRSDSWARTVYFRAKEKIITQLKKEEKP